MTDLKNPITFTANRLQDGVVVWLGRNGQWVEDVEGAVVAHTQEEQTEFASNAAKADADNIVVEPYEIDVAIENGVVTPIKFRERIRANGPTVRLDLGKQAEIAAQAARAA